MRLSALAAVTIALAACGGGSKSTVDAGRVCAPGSTQACLGPGACAGAQVCVADGANWGPCDCGTGAGGASGGGGATGSGGGAGGASGTGGGGAAGSGSGGTGGGGAAGSGSGGTGGGGAAGSGSGGGGTGGVGGSGSGGSGGSGGCTPATTTCTADGYGFQVCGTDRVPGRRVPCAVNYACVSGACSRPACLSSEIMLVLDRSSSMLDNGSWTWVVPGLLNQILYRQADNAIGLRQFPSNTGCAVGSPTTMVKGNYATIQAAIASPSASFSTPVAAALSGLVTPYGDANDGQAVILITEGDENCATQADALTAAATLWTAGIRVYVIAVTTTADRTFLDALASAGGTGQSRLATDLASFETQLNAVFSDLKSCQCDASCQCGDGNFNSAIEQCDDGNKVNGDGCSATCQALGKVLFQTSTTYSGNLGGLAGGDALCQARAAAAGLSGTFKAWLSTSTETAAARMAHSSVPYVQAAPARRVIANNWDDLVDGTLSQQMTDELGAIHQDYSWTGTDNNGTLYGTGTTWTCLDWTSDASANEGANGVNATTVANVWSVNQVSRCNVLRKLYCMEQ